MSKYLWAMLMSGGVIVAGCDEQTSDLQSQSKQIPKSQAEQTTEQQSQTKQIPKSQAKQTTEQQPQTKKKLKPQSQNEHKPDSYTHQTLPTKLLE